MILSAVLNVEHRDYIRATYANAKHLQSCAVRHVFLLARIYDVQEQKLIQSEAR
jgi:hypothetical protein